MFHPVAELILIQMSFWDVGLKLPEPQKKKEAHLYGSTRRGSKPDTSTVARTPLVEATAVERPPKSPDQQQKRCQDFGTKIRCLVEFLQCTSGARLSQVVVGLRISLVVLLNTCSND